MKTVCGVRKFYFRNAKVELLHSKGTQNLKWDIVKVGTISWQGASWSHSVFYGFFNKEEIMSHTHRTCLSVAALLFASWACTSVPDTDAISTSAAQTVIAGLTQNVPQATLSATLEATPTFTFTSAPPTFTPTETLTPTQTLTATLAFTPTPLVPLISVSVPTNCRSGPGKVYNMEGALLVGDFAEVYGRDPSNYYWYIRNPDSGSDFCWVWGKYATLTGPVLLLPIFTPPPTPTPTFTPLPTLTPTPFPAFKAEYASLDTCNGSWWVEIKLKNTGSLPLKSVNISIKDNVTNIVLVNLADGFTNLDGCLTKTTKDTLGPGDTYLLSAPAFTYNPTGDELKVILTLCSDTGQKGLCATNKIDFTP
jgi:hypothetical protein